MFRKVLIALVVLAVVIGGGVLYLHSNLDSLLRSAIVTYGSAAMKTRVALDSIHIEITSGEGMLKGLSVENPDRFSSTRALSLGVVEVVLDVGSLQGNGPIIIRKVTIDNPQILYEIDATGRTNLNTLARNAQAYAASMSGQKKEGAKPEGASRKVIIEDLVISNGQMGISQPLLKGQSVSAPLPRIHLTGIGRNSGGATVAQVIQQVLSIVTVNAAHVVTENMVIPLNPVKDAVKDGAGAIGNQLKGLLGR